MSVNDAEPDDIYVDGHGKLWRVVGYCSQPTVIMQEVETKAPDPARIFGGVGGLMWSAFKRIHRPEARKVPNFRDDGQSGPCRI